MILCYHTMILPLSHQASNQSSMTLKFLLLLKIKDKQTSQDKGEFKKVAAFNFEEFFSSSWEILESVTQDELD